MRRGTKGDVTLTARLCPLFALASLFGCEHSASPSAVDTEQRALSNDPVANDYAEYVPRERTVPDFDDTTVIDAQDRPCDFAGDGPAPLLRPGCPQEPLDVGPCETEGLECLYAADDCFDE